MRRRARKQDDKELYSLVPSSERQTEVVGQPDQYFSQEGEWIGEGGRCERCGLYFSSSNQRMESVCASHPGEFSCSGYGLTWKVSFGKWSCCGGKDPELPGCLILNTHIQCQKTLDALKKIEVGSKASLSGLVDSNSMDTRIESPLSAPERAFPGKHLEAEREGYIRHIFQQGETLPGIALMYNVSVQDIKRSNGIISSLLDPGHKMLWIPVPGTTPERRPISGASKLRALAAKQGLEINQAEAKYYLDEESGDIEAALEALKADMEWETKNSRKAGF